MTKEDLDLQYKIVKRAQTLGIARGEQITQMIDMDIASAQFNLRLGDMLYADDLNFAHDFIGIQKHMNRETCRVEDCFVPRFAGKEE